MQIGDRIKARRESLGDFSQEKLAKMLGYSGRSTINKIELNKSKVSQDMVEKFAIALKTSPAYLMGWVDNPELTHEQTLELEIQGKLNSPRIIAASTITTDGKPIAIHSYGNKKKDKLLKDIQENNIPDNILDIIDAAIAPYKK